jgi:mannose/fructose/N-acetylgalactosamine-specific phosphotransferase system component IIC
MANNPPPPGDTPPPPPPPGGAMPPPPLVLGIVGIVLCFLFVPWVLAIIFGATAIKQCNEDPTYTGKGLAIAGLICGLVGMAIIVLIFTTGETNFDFNSIGVGAVR